MTVETDQLPLSRAVALHLLPGVVIMAVFIPLAAATRSSELPVLFWFALAIPLGLVPTQLGYLMYVGKRRNGRLSLEGVLAYRRPLKWSQYLWMVPAVFLAMIVLFTLAGIADGQIYRTVFGWWPVWMNIDQVDLSTYSRPVLLTTVAAVMVFGNLVGPVVEEMYFRGYLLPRMSRFGRWAVVLNSTLFALYHFWTPWHFVQRAIGSIPLGIAAIKGNLNVSIITHVLANTIGFGLTLLAVFSAGS